MCAARAVRTASTVRAVCAVCAMHITLHAGAVCDGGGGGGGGSCGGGEWWRWVCGWPGWLGMCGVGPATTGADGGNSELLPEEGGGGRRRQSHTTDTWVCVGRGAGGLNWKAWDGTSQGGISSRLEFVSEDVDLDKVQVVSLYTLTRTKNR